MGLTDQDWIGSAVSLTCDDELGVFQGLIKKISAGEITIVRAFRNGVPLRKQNAEVVLRCADIKAINLIEPVKDTETTTPTVINKPTPVKLPHFSNILGKQQQLQQQQQQLQQLQECDKSLPVTPRSKVNGNNGRNSSGAGGLASSVGNSALSDKMHQLMLNTNANGSNGIRNTSQSSRATVAQQQQMSTTPNSVAAFFGNMIPAKVEVKLGSSVYSAGGGSLGAGSGGNNNLESNCSSSADGSYGSGEAAGGSNSSRPIDIIGNNNSNINGVYFNQGATGYGIGNGNGKRNGNGNVGSFISNSFTANGSGNGNANGNGKNGKRGGNRVRRESSLRQQSLQTFGSEADDPLLHEEFDFEGNLALFDKRAIWDDIESTHQTPDAIRHEVQVQKQQQRQEKKYRHDENILASQPLQLRQIESIFDGSKDFVTDDGLIIPTIPAYVRNRIELSAERAGLSLQRQVDILARGATDLAITLLGGARRLTPANNHQWPKIAIICDGVNTMRTLNIACATGRLLASHGLTVLLYVEQAQLIEQNSSLEVALFKATENTIVHSVDDMPTPDLVIVSTNTANLSDAIKKWLSVNRASVLAIDPPPCGIKNVAIKYSILPILPLIQDTSSTATASSAEATPTKTSTNNCGKLYLCNLGIPDKFYRDCGIKYKSPYGHKYVIPIHSKD